MIILVSSYTQLELSGYMHCSIRGNEPRGRQSIKTSVRRTHPKETTISAHREMDFSKTMTFQPRILP